MTTTTQPTGITFSGSPVSGRTSGEIRFTRHTVSERVIFEYHNRDYRMVEVSVVSDGSIIVEVARQTKSRTDVQRGGRLWLTLDVLPEWLSTLITSALDEIKNRSRFTDAPVPIDRLANDPASLACDVYGEPIIYTIVRHVSDSGMTRYIDAFVIDRETGHPLSLRAAAKDRSFPLVQWTWSNIHDGFKITGAGMDIPWLLASTLAQACGRTSHYRHMNI